jgi:hypothetical protein
MIDICALLLLATVILLKALLLLEFAQHQLRERKQGARRENDFNLLSKKYDKLHHSYDTGRYRTDLPIMRIMHILYVIHGSTSLLLLALWIDCCSNGSGEGTAVPGTVFVCVRAITHTKR